MFNELLCLALAKAVNLAVANAEVGKIDGMDFLLVERYDRKLVQPSDGIETMLRLHQEDFCQALAIPSRNKYQSEGGPSLKDCFKLVREVSSIPVTDLQRLLDAAIFNYLIGNNDAHGKNFSLVYHDDGSIRLAPLYDLAAVHLVTASLSASPLRYNGCGCAIRAALVCVMKAVSGSQMVVNHLK